MRKALVVGVNHYQTLPCLFGCLNDAHQVKGVLERHSDGSINFAVKLLAASCVSDQLGRAALREAIRDLFVDDSEISLFYFAGHGHIDATGGYICSSDCAQGSDGVSLSEVINLANISRARNKIIVLDSCYSGIAGGSPVSPQTVEMTEGLTILTASTANQYASEANGSGVFTSLFVDALNGAAGNLVGDVTPGSVYAHIDQSLGPWDQRPVFKTNVKSFVSLRKVQPPISLAELQRITEFFPMPGFEYQLDETYEPESVCPNKKNTAKFAVLQKYNRVNLVVPVNAPHMYHAAIGGKSCKLTALGEHYRKLVHRGLI